jgi:AcrR family transcriptional regulator
MVRTKAVDKREAILGAATAVFAAGGVWSTPTSAVSKAAGVGEGTLFIYFATKADLVNALYRELKGELATVILSSYPRNAADRLKIRYIWDRYVNWGVDNPDKFKVLAQLNVSDHVTAESRFFAQQQYVELERLAQDCIRRKVIRKMPAQFLGTMLATMAETTMGFVACFGVKPVDYRSLGFDMFWNSIATAK